MLPCYWGRCCTCSLQRKERHFKDDILHAKRNVFQVTGLPLVSWLIVSSIGQVSVECRSSIGQVSAKCRPGIGDLKSYVGRHTCRLILD